MSDPLRTAAAGIQAQQTRMEIVANDLANISTIGYRKGLVDFRDLAYEGPDVARIGSGTTSSLVGRSVQQGRIDRTGNPLDLAIDGPGFFQVRLQDGSVVLTRAGQLRIDAQGALVTATGDRLEPPVQLPQGADLDKIEIEENGAVRIGGRTVGTITLVDVPAPQNLQSVGDSQFAATRASGPISVLRNPVLHQGALEASNIELGDAMVELMDAQRSFELATRAFKMLDEVMELANGIRR